MCQVTYKQVRPPELCIVNLSASMGACYFLGRQCSAYPNSSLISFHPKQMDHCPHCSILRCQGGKPSHRLTLSGQGLIDANRDLLQTLVFSALVPGPSMADSKRKRPWPPGSSCQPMTPGVSDNFPNFMAILMGQL